MMGDVADEFGIDAYIMADPCPHCGELCHPQEETCQECGKATGNKSELTRYEEWLREHFRKSREEKK